MPDTIPPITWLRAVLGFTAVPIAHRYRLEVNFESLPVNRPKCLIHTYNRDGFMRFDENGGEGPNYEPNSFDGLVEDPRHYNVQRVFDVYANTQNRDLGGVAQQVQKIVDQMKPHLPRSTTLAIRGQIQSMNVSYFGLGVVSLLPCLRPQISALADSSPVARKVSDLENYIRFMNVGCYFKTITPEAP
jgi:hypothetical protein